MLDESAAISALPRVPGRKIIRREDADNWIDGYRFVADARRAADVLAQTAQAAFDENKARGFDDGRRAGEAEAAALLAETSIKVDHYLASIESQVADLSLAIVEQVLGRLDDAEIVARAAKQALASFRREKYLKVRVSPSVHDDVRRALATWPEPDGAGPVLSVEADPRLGPRQCTVATEFAVVDASLDAQLTVIRRVLAANGREGPPS
jgi:type III secretion protein L